MCVWLSHSANVVYISEDEFRGEKNLFPKSGLRDGPHEDREDRDHGPGRR